MTLTVRRLTLLYHGWVDSVGPPQDSINYYIGVGKQVGAPAKLQRFVRLFMVPGMSHCDGGNGYEVVGGAQGIDDPDGVPKWPTPDAAHDMLDASDAWVSHGDVPQEIIAAHYEDGKVTRTIPVCAYPKLARWNGKGSVDEEINFVCVAPKR